MSVEALTNLRLIVSDARAKDDKMLQAQTFWCLSGVRFQMKTCDGEIWKVDITII